MGWSLLPRHSDRRSGRLYRSCIAELVGTFSYIFWGCMVQHSLSNSTTSATTTTDNTETLGVAIGFGAALAATVHIFSDISGSHFNPAVSLAMFVVQRISLTRMFLYWIMQILGALLAIAILDACELKMGETHLNSDTVNVGQGFLFELFGTLLWVYVALAATNELRGTVKSNIEYPLYVGLAFILLHLALVPLTGCGLNPPRSLLANAFFGTIEGYDWVYVVAPLVAAVLGGFSYELIFSNYYTDLSSSYMKNSKPINSIPKQ